MREKSSMSGGEGTPRKPMIKPEGGRSTTADIDISDRPIGVELIIYDSPEIAM